MRSLLAAGGFADALQLLTIVENDNSLSHTTHNISVDSAGDAPMDPDCPANVSYPTFNMLVPEIPGVMLKSGVIYSYRAVFSS